MRKFGFMMRVCQFVAVLLVAISPAQRSLEAQTSTPPPAVRDSVLGVVQGLFDAMAARDTAAARRLLVMDGHAFATYRAGDTTGVGSMGHEQFLKALAPPGDPWRERMWNPTVLVHGDLAVVWAPYDFHNGTTFSHCGVDTFTLLRTQRGWRLADLAYTVERTACAPSPLGPIK